MQERNEHRLQIFRFCDFNSIKSYQCTMWFLVKLLIPKLHWDYSVLDVYLILIFNAFLILKSLPIPKLGWFAWKSYSCAQNHSCAYEFPMNSHSEWVQIVNADFCALSREKSTLHDTWLCAQFALTVNACKSKFSYSYCVRHSPPQYSNSHTFVHSA